ncbi:hypothetical protein [Entomohabitans teleogrylli]|nr:hypothetical protein [Entomohabitans teleogrylli]
MKAGKIVLIAGMVILSLGGIGGVMLAGYSFIVHGG